MVNFARFYQRIAPGMGHGPATLYIDPPLHPAQFAPPVERLAVFTQDFARWRRLGASEQGVEFGVFPAQVPGEWNDIVLALPREKGLLDIWLQWCAAALAPAGRLWLAGENRSGIKSAGRRLEALFAEVAKLDGARHCALFRAQRPAAVAAFDEDEHFAQWDFTARGRAFTAWSMPGVFSHGRLDPGTGMLLEALDPAELAGAVLDFACGAGVIATVLKVIDPALAITLLDSSALALAASRRTLDANGASGEIVASDGLSEISGTFDLVVSNPPFHQGVATESGMSMALLGPVRNFLNPDGQLVLVANRHLPYRKWLDSLFGGHEVLAADNRYHVLRARRH